MAIEFHTLRDTEVRNRASGKIIDLSSFASVIQKHISEFRREHLMTPDMRVRHLGCGKVYLALFSSTGNTRIRKSYIYKKKLTIFGGVEYVRVQ